MEPPSSILQWKHRAENSWYLETLALAGSLISLLVMVALLFRFDGSPTFHWYGLSLNTIVSISSTASKAWLLLAVSEAISQWKWIMFSQMRHRLRDFEVVDSASRGPLGCFEVLARRTGGVALALGALITILTLAMDPFAQQLLGVHSEMHYIPQSNATLAIARRYAKAITRDSLYPEGSYASDYGMQAAFITGLSAQRSIVTQQLPFNCPTGNCKWDPFQSLAVCSSCQDITKLLINGTQNIAENGASTTVYGKVLPNGAAFTRDDKPNMGTFATNTKNDTFAFADNNLMFWSMVLVNNTGNSSVLGGGTVATECMLQYCVRQYNSSVINGTLVEQSSIVDAAKRSSRSWMPGGEMKINWTVEDTWAADDELAHIPKAIGIKRTDLMIGDGYNISQAAVLGTTEMLKSVLLLNGQPAFYEADTYSGASVHTHGSVTSYYFGKENLYSGSVVWDNIANEPVANPVYLQPIYDSGNLTHNFETIATSMSNAIRTGADIEESKASAPSGHYGFAVSIYRVRWPWIALPFTLVIFGFFFLLLASRQSSKAGIPVWKSCPIAVMERGGCIQTHIRGPLQTSALHEKSDNLYARLVDGGGLDLSVRDSLLSVEKAKSTSASQRLLSDTTASENMNV